MPLLILAVLGAGFLLVHGLGVLAWAGGAVAALLWYRWDVRRHPRVSCRMCRGSGDHRSGISGKHVRTPFGDCWCCGGRKTHPRFAARLLDPAGHAEEKRRIEKGRAKI